MTGIDNVRSYTETRHTVYADVSGFDPVEVTDPDRPWRGARRFTPERLVVNYIRHTQVDNWWEITIDVSGHWLATVGSRTDTVPGSGVRRFALADAPAWAGEFALTHTPAEPASLHTGVDSTHGQS